MLQALTVKYVGVLRARDVAQLNLTSTKGKFMNLLIFLPVLLRTAINFYLLPLDHLSQVNSDRDTSNARVSELEAEVATLKRELAEANKEAATTVTRAKDAEAKERATSRQEEELTRRVQAMVNSLSG